MDVKLTREQKLTILRKFLSDKGIQYDEKDLLAYPDRLYEILERNKEDADIALVFGNISTINDWLSFNIISWNINYKIGRKTQFSAEEIYQGVKAEIISNQEKANRINKQKRSLDTRFSRY